MISRYPQIYHNIFLVVTIAAMKRAKKQKKWVFLEKIIHKILYFSQKVLFLTM